MRIDIDEVERTLLLNLLDELLGDLRGEIYRAERHDFKEQLRAKKALVQGLIGRLRPGAPAASGIG